MGWSFPCSRRGRPTTKHRPSRPADPAHRIGCRHAGSPFSRPSSYSKLTTSSGQRVEERMTRVPVKLRRPSGKLSHRPAERSSLPSDLGGEKDGSVICSIWSRSSSMPSICLSSSWRIGSRISRVAKSLRSPACLMAALYALMAPISSEWSPASCRGTSAPIDIFQGRSRLAYPPRRESGR